MKFMIEAIPSFSHKCEGKLQKRVHMLPVHPGVHMSETNVPQQAEIFRLLRTDVDRTK